ncbi:conidiophore development protein hyma [Dipsacomyces acuminosporus]|nr:conidiophore development protein hyma [Dipsacomyces acuminosporus]
MNFFFKSKQKGPVELVKATHDAMAKIDSGEHQRNKANDEIAKNVSSMLQIFREGGADKKVPEVTSEQVTQLAQEIYTTELLPLLISNLARLEFETRKEVSIIFGILLRRKIGTRQPTIEYLLKREPVLKDLIRGYENPDAAVFCGNMLRECLKHESLASTIINLPEFFNFFTYVEGANFDVASDAFANFRDTLTKFKAPANKFLQENYDKFFAKYTDLLLSSNYVIRRQSLKLLGEILLERRNFHVMTRYINYSDNLKLVMNALGDKSKSIQYEAFHIFKIFVANPNKTPEVFNILRNNRDKLIGFLSKFQTDKDSDEQFKDEKAFLIREIQKLRPPASSQA